MAILTREEILGAADITKELVHVPEWGGDVYVTALTGAERDRWEASILVQKGKRREVSMSDLRAKLAALAMCDEHGRKMFSEVDVKALSQKSAAALQRVFEVAQRLSGLSDEAVEELTEDLKNAPSDGSSSG